MTEDTLAHIDANTASALAAYRGARDTAWRCPSADNLRIMDEQRERVDFYLDCRARRMSREQLDAAYSRPLRVAVPA